MTPEEIRSVVREVISEERRLYADQTDVVILKTVAAILTTFGLEDEDKREIRDDFAHLRKWRKSVEAVERIGWTTAITVIVTGLLGALLLGVKALLGK